MKTFDDMEARRLEVEKSLSSAKTQSERNKMGQFATPPGLASDIIRHAKALLPRALKIRFLDPAFGTGSFYSALLRTFRGSNIAKATGYEIDRIYAREAKKLWKQTPLELHLADFTRATSPDSDGSKANLIVCNPPYVRHHHLSAREKRRLRMLVGQITGVRFNGLAGLYCYFLGISHAWLAKNGLAAWLIPSEFMDVNYGKAVKDYLLDDVTLLRMHRYDPSDIQFPDALVSSAVLFFRNSQSPHDGTVEVTFGGSLANPRISKLVPVDSLRSVAKWTGLSQSHARKKPRGSPKKLSDFFEIKRGLATGANRFFVMTPDEARKRRLPQEFLIPILPSPRYVTNDEIAADRLGNPRLARKLFLLTCDLPQSAVRGKYPSLWAYLQQGVEDGIERRYLCSHRTPWYSQEVRPPSPVLCTYMGRKAHPNDRAFRFILNRSKATAPNVYLMLYPKPPLQRRLDKNPRLLRAVWHALKRISPDTLINEGRVYGGGLHKIEPKELANAPGDNILEIMPDFTPVDKGQMTLFD